MANTATAADWYAGIQRQQDEKARAAGLDPITARVMEQYGYLAAYLDHPEIGPLLREAATKGWSKEILQGRLYKTAWWQTTAATRRELDLLKTTDPAEYTQRRNAKAAELQIMAQKGGAWFSNYQDVLALADRIMADPSLSPETIQYMVFAHATYTGKTPSGQMGATMDAIKARASEYYVPLSDKAAFDWSRRIQMGVATVESADSYLRQQAMSRFSHLADEIEAGSTVKELFDPYIQQTAQLLEISPDMVDLNDSRFKRMISHRDPEAGKNRAMTLSEAEEFIKMSPEYDTTKGAMNETAGFVQKLAEGMGEVRV